MPVLVEISPRRPADGVAVPLRLIGGATERADHFGQQWHPALARAPRISSRLGFNGRTFGEGAVSTVGEIAVALGSAHLSAFTGYAYANAAVTIKTGPAGGADGAFSTIWTGRAADAAVAGNKMTIRLADPAEELRRPVLADTFAGTGDLEGPPDLAGRPKPTAWGRCENIPAILLDPAYLIYLLVDRQATVDAVKDGGAPFDAGPVAADLAALRALAVPAGAVATMSTAAATLVRPWKRPTFALTADITAGSLTKPAEIAQAMVAGRTAVPFKAGAVAAYDAAQPGPIGTYIDDDRTMVDELDRIFAGLGSFWKLSSAGEIDCGQFAFGASVQTFEREVAEVGRRAIVMPTKKRFLGYRRNFRPLGDSEIAGIVAADEVGGVAAEVISRHARYLTFDDFEYTADADFLDHWTAANSDGERSFTAGRSGSRALRIGNNAGDDSGWYIGKEKIPYNQDLIYRVRASVRRVSGSGNLYLGINGWAADKVTKVDSTGGDTHFSQHFVGANGLHPTNFGASNGDWFVVTGYLSGKAAPGDATPHHDPTDPGQAHSAVFWVSTLFGCNWAASTGEWEIDWIEVAAVDKDAAPGATVGAQTGINLKDDAGAVLVEGKILNANLNLAADGALTYDFGGGPINLGLVQLAGLGFVGDLNANLGEKTVHRGTFPPGDTSKQWIDLSTTPNVLKIFHGGSWVKVTPTVLSELGGVGTLASLNGVDTAQLIDDAVDALKIEPGTTFEERGPLTWALLGATSSWVTVGEFTPSISVQNPRHRVRFLAEIMSGINMGAQQSTHSFRLMRNGTVEAGSFSVTQGPGTATFAPEQVDLVGEPSGNHTYELQRRWSDGTVAFTTSGELKMTKILLP